MDRERIPELIKHLKWVAKRPSMYVGAADPVRVDNYLLGLLTAVNQLFGVDDMRVREQVLADRGLRTDRPLISQVRAKRLSNRKQIDLLIEVESEVLARLYDAIPKPKRPKWGER
ncbi:MAG TPA: hypothetical protein VNC50_13625 [Planctomycetia bacterium]|nr:hypothetical protein [Planctomycetia bacterium]